MIISFDFYVLIISMLIGSRILGIDMDDDNEVSIPIDEGSNGSFGEADETFDVNPDSNYLSVDAPDHDIEGELLPGVPF